MKEKKGRDSESRGDRSETVGEEMEGDRVKAEKRQSEGRYRG